MKIGIVGCGMVGMAAASAIFRDSLASELILVDIDKEKACGEAMDLMHAQAYTSRCSVSQGDYNDLQGAEYIVFSSGVSQKTGESRIDLLNRNIEILRPIISELDTNCPDAKIIVATNPVDILTYCAGELSCRSKSKIIGTGTMLDTSRFRSALGSFYQVNPKSIHAYVVGEHGNSEVLLWSSAMIAGKRIKDSNVLGKTLSEKDIKDIDDEVRNAAYKIIDKKGYTSWAIGFVIAHLIRTIESDQKSILALSVRAPKWMNLSGACIGLPCLVGKDGVEKVVDLDLSPSEKELLRSSHNYLADIITKLNL